MRRAFTLPWLRGWYFRKHSPGTFEVIHAGKIFCYLKHKNDKWGILPPHQEHGRAIYMFDSVEQAMQRVLARKITR